MQGKKPNHICRYSGCTLNEDGGRKRYYACSDCDRRMSWRASACCPEHYQMYAAEVTAARSAAISKENAVSANESGTYSENVIVPATPEETNVIDVDLYLPRRGKKKDSPEN